MYFNTKEYNKLVYQVPIACVDLLIIFQKKCLLLKRKNSPAKGEFWFPGGRIHKMETIEQACIRISKEETNLDCNFINQICIEETLFNKKDEMLSDKHTLNICCLLEVESISKLQIDKNHSDFFWLDKISTSLHNSIVRPLGLIGFK